MERETGNYDYPLWILGDSEPQQWKDKLDLPLDDRHPIVHNIWTSIIDKIQERVYLIHKARVDTNKIFIRNAVTDPVIKTNAIKWNDLLEKELLDYASMIRTYKPKLIFSFGAFAYEFGRRSLGEYPEYSYKYWGAKKLGDEFRIRINQKKETILIPLLHRSIAGGKFIESHTYYCDTCGKNYFTYAAESLSQVISDMPECFIK